MFNAARFTPNLEALLIKKYRQGCGTYAGRFGRRVPVAL
jgi:hypothetical protein